MMSVIFENTDGGMVLLPVEGVPFEEVIRGGRVCAYCHGRFFYLKATLEEVQKKIREVQWSGSSPTLTRTSPGSPPEKKG